ncbi:hypothetical protein RF11_10225 [Thelohanellus kitauei]|uniref:Uncharacterized protein n=1 Tax=Thelohanellus kitauei TaxID=669202 RepID=A0A0C2MBM3_THEKT|nr:hypothetical protein RF11_10225 [Thelohanellus kitauei]
MGYTLFAVKPYFLECYYKIWLQLFIPPPLYFSKLCIKIKNVPEWGSKILEPKQNTILKKEAKPQNATYLRATYFSSQKHTSSVNLFQSIKTFPNPLSFTILQSKKVPKN